MALALLGEPLSICPKMCTGAVSVFPGRFPATTTMDLNSPSARANVSSPPEMMAGISAGSITCRNVCHCDAPRE